MCASELLIFNIIFFFFFNDTATTEIYTLSLLDALPIYESGYPVIVVSNQSGVARGYFPLSLLQEVTGLMEQQLAESGARRSEEHTSELQSRLHLVCRLLLEKKKNQQHIYAQPSISLCDL